MRQDMESPTTPTIGASLDELASPVPLEASESNNSIESIRTNNNDNLDLPAELWFLIFSRLDVVSLLVVSQVHRRWTRITNDPTLWRDLCFQHLVCLNDEETKRIFEESLTPGTQLNAWKKIFIRHHKTEQRNRVLGKLFWASYEFTALQRFLNLPSAQGARNGTSARLLTYEGQSVACRQCERERELLELLDVSTANDDFKNERFPPTRTLYGHNGVFLDRLGPLALPTRASMILHTLQDGCEHGTGLSTLVSPSLIVKSRSPYLSGLLHESMIGSTIGRVDSHLGSLSVLASGSSLGGPSSGAQVE